MLVAMKNIYKLLAIVLVLVPQFVFASFDTNLKYGSKGDEVRELQEFLTDQGVYSGPITGNFYTLTLKAVKVFQARENITPVSGFFGPLTRTRANAVLSVDLAESVKEEQLTPPTVPPVVTQPANPAPTPAPVLNPAPQPTPTVPTTPQPTPAPVPISKANIEIFSPTPGKGLGRQYKANNYQINPDGTLAQGSATPDDSNSIVLGLIARNDNGDAVIKYDVTIEATDPPNPDCFSCRRFIKGTGTDQTGIGAVTKIYKDGVPETVSYYPFLYEFKTSGQHTITFSANGFSKSVTVTAQ